MISEFYKNKRVLVTGHTGFKGSWLCMILLEMGAKVCGIGLEPNTNPSIYTMLNLEQKIQSNICDIRDLEHVREIFYDFKPEVVFHLAAQPLVLDSYEQPVYTYEVNVVGTLNICECIRETSSVKSFINVTTDKVYMNKEEKTHLYSEFDELNGFDPYSNSKSCAELITSCYVKSFFNAKNLPVSTCRAGNVIGGGDFSKNRIIPDCVDVALNGGKIRVRNQNSIRPYQHVLEADMFYLYLAKKQWEDLSLSGSYNVGPYEKDAISTGVLCDIFVCCWGENISWEAKELEGPHEANFLRLSINKAISKLAWKPVWNVKMAVTKVVEWAKVYRSNGDIENITKKQINEYMEECTWL
ncbi:MAG: CDP-glucose 4,6-dehydratase [Erysipelotrichales bacterium]|nr:CDP-glucose 4,6-dehydratase [Erysipelotrichales bacterium]